MMTKNKKAIILLSGGLDSLVSLAILQREYDIVRAIFFNYGQKSYKQEFLSCEKICKYYNIDLEVVELDWYKNLSKNSALNINTNGENKSYWMPNRNGLFLNIAGAYADALACQYVIIGANKEEANVYSDNSKQFIMSATKLFETSTKEKVEVVAPLIEMDKSSIIKKAIEINAPLEMLWSCYEDKEKHCGACPSCKFLKQALLENNKQDLVAELF